MQKQQKLAYTRAGERSSNRSVQLLTDGERPGAVFWDDVVQTPPPVVHLVSHRLKTAMSISISICTVQIHEASPLHQVCLMTDKNK